ncbi:MAG: hypothetical protein QXQ46_09025 [Thermoplasmatales archaeon]
MENGMSGVKKEIYIGEEERPANILGNLHENIEIASLGFGASSAVLRMVQACRISGQPFPCYITKQTSLVNSPLDRSLLVLLCIAPKAGISTRSAI